MQSKEYPINSDACFGWFLRSSCQYNWKIDYKILNNFEEDMYPGRRQEKMC